jgi:hypothetical protein
LAREREAVDRHIALELGRAKVRRNGYAARGEGLLEVLLEVPDAREFHLLFLLLDLQSVPDRRAAQALRELAWETRVNPSGILAGP